MEVLVFRTSVETSQAVSQLKPLLDSFAGEGRWNFALDDCDRILRISSTEINPESAISLLKERGFNCSELEN